ncbi:hypothetical protein GcM3_083025 [Golovinomyces cichoracearum]|uniref:Uncharacterized protein n=1 Tax=Golovinomyces cichoracearum TaxID=62708 RepID=A0A420IML7_9PEZI|nr:hypothetical protein GcM3_083025 [Golovinomyces cichoracearum]
MKLLACLETLKEKKKKASSSKTVDKFMFYFNTRRIRRGSAPLFEDSEDREDSPSEVKRKKTKLEDLTIADSRNDTASLRLNAIFNTPTTSERAHKITRGLGFETKSEIATGKMPALNLPLFDGDGQDADRWLAMLKLDFGAANIDSETHPQLWLEAIYTKVAGKAEDWMDRTLKIKNIMATRQTATITEVKIFEAKFQSRFSGRVAITQQASPFLHAQSLKQEPHE